MAESLREVVKRESGGFCEYCRVPQAFDRLPFQIDHVIAEKHGGPTERDNLAWSCFDCNCFKGPNIAGIDPQDPDSPTPLYHPRRQVWYEHFECVNGRIVGLSPEGRATIETLRMNLPRRIALRRALMDEGVYPIG